MDLGLTIPQHIEQLDCLNEEEIKELLDNPQLIQHFAYDISSTLREMREHQQSEIMRIAHQNLNKKEEIDLSIQNNQEVRNDVDELTAIHDSLQDKEQQVLQKYGKDKINAAFNKAMDALNNECDSLKQKYENDEVSLIAFIKQFTENKRMYHLLCIKQEKYNEFYH
eukprot:84756_1